jgi:hypothetical protein
MQFLLDRMQATEAKERIKQEYKKNHPFLYMCKYKLKEWASSFLFFTIILGLPFLIGFFMCWAFIKR